MEIHFKEDNGPIEEVIKHLMQLAGGIPRPAIVREMILASLKAGQEDNGKVDLKLMNTSLKEMRFTAKVFNPYNHFKKVSVFGSARTKSNDALYKMAYDLGAKLAESGYMVITGGGPGIMQAVHEGAGPDHSFGVNIRLPSEQDSNPVIKGNSKNIMYKYFFNRKVAFLKESDAVVIFPGGFGTHDEAMETLALVQTGKHNPLPIILVDEPEGKYWLNWINFIRDELLGKNYISKADMHLFDLAYSAKETIQIINKFYSRYHSIRQIGSCCAIRLNKPLEEEKLEDINERYCDILKTDGKICLSEALPEETDESEISNLPRIIIDFNKTDYGKLKQLIDEINL